MKFAELKDGQVAVLHQGFPPHLWDGEKMVRIDSPAPAAPAAGEMVEAERERCAKILEARAARYRERAAMPGLTLETAEQRIYGAEVCENAAYAIRSGEKADD